METAERKKHSMGISTVDLGNVKGPQGEPGAPGAPGPNQISGDTGSTLTGLLKGAGGQVAAAVAGADYVAGDDYSHWAVGMAAYTSGGVYTLTVTHFPTAYVKGMVLLVDFEGERDHPDCYLNINGLGVKRIYTVNETIPPKKMAGLHLVLYDGTAWRMLDSLYGGGKINGDLYAHSIYPEPDAGAFDLGTQTYKWNKVYAYDTDFLNLYVINDANISGDLGVSGTTTTRDIVPDSGGVRNIGSDSNRYAELYAHHGTLNGLMVTGPVSVQESVSATSGIFTAIATVGGNNVWHDGLITTTTTTIKGNSGSSFTLYFYKIGRLVMVDCPDWINLEGVAHNQRVGTIPAEYRPQRSSFAAVLDRAGYFMLKFYSDGSMTIQLPPDQTSFYGYMNNLCYMTA